MARPEFEEKEYEVAFAVELGQSMTYVRSSGQVLEKVVGYDAATNPAAQHEVWRMLRLRRPPGIRLVVPLWAPGKLPPQDRLPASAVSLLLQYKRPEFMVGPNASQWRLWGQPYYRFTRTGHQQRILVRLERHLGGRAMVRYAAAAFHLRGELEQHMIQSAVIRNSGFVEPRGLGSHSVWTYLGPGIVGRANPDGEPIRFETFEDLFTDHGEPTISRADLVENDEDRLDAHLALLGAVAREREPSLRIPIERWLRAAAAAEIQLSATTKRRIADIASITTLMHRIGGSWHLVAPPGSSS
jgi:hypothetical protein